MNLAFLSCIFSQGNMGNNNCCETPPQRYLTMKNRLKCRFMHLYVLCCYKNIFDALRK